MAHPLYRRMRLVLRIEIFIENYKNMTGQAKKSRPVSSSGREGESEWSNRDLQMVSFQFNKRLNQNEVNSTLLQKQ